MTNYEVTAQIDAASVANAATVQEYRANWRCVNETNAPGTSPNRRGIGLTPMDTHDANGLPMRLKSLEYEKVVLSEAVSKYLGNKRRVS